MIWKKQPVGSKLADLQNGQELLNSKFSDRGRWFFTNTSESGATKENAIHTFINSIRSFMTSGEMANYAYYDGSTFYTGTIVKVSSKAYRGRMLANDKANGFYISDSSDWSAATITEFSDLASKVVYEDYVQAIEAFTAGDPGSRALQYVIATNKTGYSAVAATIKSHPDSARLNCKTFLVSSNNNVYLNVYRASGAAYTGGSATVRVLFLKN